MIPIAQPRRKVLKYLLLNRKGLGVACKKIQDIKYFKILFLDSLDATPICTL